jgi:hypothetical protein
LKFVLCAHLFPQFSIMYLCLTPNLLYFLPNLGELYALRRTPNFYEIHPRLEKELFFVTLLGQLMANCLLYLDIPDLSKLPHRRSFVWKYFPSIQPWGLKEKTSTIL